MRAAHFALLANALSFFCGLSFAQNSDPEPHLMVSNGGEHFQYSILHPEKARRAWIEVMDRPILIDQRSVDVQRYGEFDWQWDRTQLNDYEQPDDVLKLGLWDPDGTTIYCVDTTMYSQRGGEVFGVTAGGRTKYELAPGLFTTEVRALRGTPNFTFEVLGADLTSDLVLHVFSDNGAQCQDRFLHTTVLDLAHARVTLDRECLLKPGTLFLSTVADAQALDMNSKVWVHIAGHNSSELRSVSPSQLSGEEPESQLSFVVRGRHFTTGSKVIASYMPTVTSIGHGPEMHFATEYISPNELHAKADASFSNYPVSESVCEDRTGQRDSCALRIWVQGDENKFELSEPRDVEVLVNGQKPRNFAIITSVSPYPIQLMSQHSSEELKVTVHGENFVPGVKVMSAFGFSDRNHKELRTEYVSPTTLHAWIPRQYWRKHKVMFRLVVETGDGKQYTSQDGLKEDEE
jgi:hypothetical protein